MNKILSYFLLFILAQNLSAQSADVDVLKKLNQDFGNSIVRKDSTTLSNILADDFFMVNPSGNKLSKKDNLSLLSSSNIEFTSLVIDSVDIRIITPEVGIINCWQTFIYKVDGKEMSGRNCYQDIYVKRKDKWQAISAHVTPLSNK
jgi:hypothetical protein